MPFVNRVETPCFVVDQGLLERNLQILKLVKDRTGCRILLALKGFAMWSLFPVVRESLDGTCASSPNEARLGREEFGKEVHVFAAAYSETHFSEIISHADHVVFNSFVQAEKFIPSARMNGSNASFGMRVNPEHSEAPVAMYDPCAPCSRLGVRREQFNGRNLDGISGLHFHTLCEQNADALARTLDSFEHKFGDIIGRMEWVNFGGGHHITRKDYDVDLLCDLITGFRKRHNVTVYLEPGEAVALNTGFLVGTVLDIVHNGMDIAILDTSAAAHMPDVLEMPYRPSVDGAGLPGEKKHTYRLAGLSCLAGDIIGDYSFDSQLSPGDRIVFLDMAHYTMVKTNTFNGIGLPSIYVYHPVNDGITLVKKFGYTDFRERLS